MAPFVVVPDRLPRLPPVAVWAYDHLRSLASSSPHREPFGVSCEDRNGSSDWMTLGSQSRKASATLRLRSFDQLMNTLTGGPPAGKVN